MRFQLLRMTHRFVPPTRVDPLFRTLGQGGPIVSDHWIGGPIVSGQWPDKPIILDL